MPDYYVYDNFDALSRILAVCPEVSFGFLRNCFITFSNEQNWNVVSPDHESSRDASGITGIVTHIHQNDGSANYEYMYPGSIVRNGDYIYMYHRVEPNGDQPPWEPCVFFAAPDASAKKLIFSVYEWQGDEIDWNYADTVFIFDPETLQFTKIFDAPNYGECYIVSDHLHAYFYDSTSHQFYQAIPFTLKGTCIPDIDDPDYFLWSASVALDEDGPSFWYLDNTSLLLTAFDMSGNIKAQIQTTIVETYRSYTENPIHIGDSIIVVVVYSHNVGYIQYKEIRIYHYHK